MLTRYQIHVIYVGMVHLAVDRCADYEMPPKNIAQVSICHRATKPKGLQQSKQRMPQHVVRA